MGVKKNTLFPRFINAEGLKRMVPGRMKIGGSNMCIGFD